MAKAWSFGALTAALKGAAFLDVGTSAKTVAAGDDTRIVNAYQKSGGPISGDVQVGGLLEASRLKAYTAVQLPETQGAFLMWNRVSGSGTTDFVNHKGAGSGGYVFWNGDNKSQNKLMTIAASGALYTEGGLFEMGNRVYNAANKPSPNDLGAVDKTGDTMSGTLQSTSANFLVAKSRNYGFIQRFDGGSYYTLFTNENDVNGNWNSLRPLEIRVDGSVNLAGPATRVDNLRVPNGISRNDGSELLATSGDITLKGVPSNTGFSDGSLLSQIGNKFSEKVTNADSRFLTSSGFLEYLSSKNLLGSCIVDGSWKSFINARHRDGVNDGTRWGFAVIDENMTSGSLGTISIRKQINNVWSNPCYLYHTGNKPSASDVGALPSNGNAVSATKLQNTRSIGGVNFDGTSNINLPGVNTQGNQNTSGNAATATKLQTARSIGGVNFDGGSNINLPGVNIGGNQSTSGNAATATRLQNARTIGGVNFDGTSPINLPGVNIQGNQNTSGNAATATKLQNARRIGGVSFDGSGDINLPGVNTGGNQPTSGNAGSATRLQNTRSIGGVNFDGTSNINLPGVNTQGNQNTTGNAATATRLQNGRRINGTVFDGTGDIKLDLGLKVVAMLQFATFGNSPSGDGAGVHSFKSIDANTMEVVIQDRSHGRFVQVGQTKLKLMTEQVYQLNGHPGTSKRSNAGEPVIKSMSFPSSTDHAATIRVTIPSHGVAVGSTKNFYVCGYIYRAVNCTWNSHIGTNGGIDHHQYVNLSSSVSVMNAPIMCSSDQMAYQNIDWPNLVTVGVDNQPSVVNASLIDRSTFSFTVCDTDGVRAVAAYMCTIMVYDFA